MGRSGPVGSRLHRALVLAHLRERLRRDDVGDGTERALFSVGRRCLAPPIAGEAVLLPEEGEEDLGLLVAEAREGLQTPEHRGAVGIAPQGGRVASPVVDERLAERLDARGHRSREPVHRGGLPEDRDELVGVGSGQRGRIEVVPAAGAVGDLAGTGEGGLHRDLLVQEHPDEQGERIIGQEAVGVVVTGDVQGHDSIVTPIPLPRGAPAAGMTEDGSMPDPIDLISRAQSTRVVVIGGSVAGLVAALECAKVGMDVTLLEATGRLGGEVESLGLDGVRVDVMVDTFAAGGATVQTLLRDLGLESRLAAAPEPVRAVSGADGVHPLPTGAVLGIPANAWDPAVRRIIGWRGVWRAYLDRLRPPLTIGHQRNLGALVRSRMGDRVAERMVAPVARGVLGLDPDRVDVEEVAPGLGTALTRTGSLAGAVDALDGEGPRETLEGGVAALVDALVDALTAHAVRVRCDAPVTELAREGDRWRILVDAPEEAASGDGAGGVEAEEVAVDPSTSVLRADVVVMASGAPDARRLLSEEIELPALASEAAHDVVLLRGDLPLVPGLQVFPRGSAGAVLVEGIAVPEHSRTAASEGIARVVLTGSGRGDADALADALGVLAEVASRPVSLDAVSVAVHRSVIRTARGELDQRLRTNDVRAASRSVPGLALVGAAIVGGDLRDVVEDAVTEIGRVRRAALWGDDTVAVDDAGSSGASAGAS